MDCVDYEYLDASKKISNRECLLYGLLLDSDGSSGYITVYDGDSTSDLTFGVFDVLANSETVILFPTPVRLQRGLYIDLTSHVDHVTVLWRPLPV